MRRFNVVLERTARNVAFLPITAKDAVCARSAVQAMLDFYADEITWEGAVGFEPRIVSIEEVPDNVGTANTTGD